MARVLILGCGRIGSAAANVLRRDGTHEVVVGDVSPDSAIRLDDGVEFHTADQVNWPKGDFDYVVNTLPHDAISLVAKQAVDRGVNYLDITEDVGQTAAVLDVARNASSAVIPQCGLAPGFINILANDAAKWFEDLRSLKLRVGSLPMYPTNAPVNYCNMWSVDGVVNEYLNDCDAIVDGAKVKVPGMSALESLVIDGVDYEAFATSGGVGLMLDRFVGRVRDMDYKTLRYPGHHAAVRVLVDGFGMDRPMLKRAFANLPTTQQDIVVVGVTAQGRPKRGDPSFATESWWKVISNNAGRLSPWRGLTAIQMTTACSVLAVMDMHASGQLPAAGYVDQSAVSFDAFRLNRFGRALFEG